MKDVMVENSTYSRGSIKERLYSELGWKKECITCGQGPIHMNQPLVHELDHINGVHNDHRMENLRILCPNCHSQTDTFRGRNCRIVQAVYRCIDCNLAIKKESVRCGPCNKKYRKREKTQVEKDYQEALQLAIQAEKDAAAREYNEMAFERAANEELKAVQRIIAAQDKQNAAVEAEKKEKQKATKENTYKCVDCGENIATDSERCVTCYRVSRRKVTDRPSLETLKADVKALKAYDKVGKKYDVSGTTIRKWIRTAEREISNPN